MDDLTDEEDENALDEAIMSQPHEGRSEPKPQGNAPREGGMTLDGAAADTPLPKGWGQPQRKTGRVGDWTAGTGARKEGG